MKVLTGRHPLEAYGKRRRPLPELAKDQPLSRPAVSQHLKVLEEASLVRVEPRGNRRLYSVRRDGLDELRRYLESFWSDVLNAYSTEIARRMKDDPSRRTT